MNKTAFIRRFFLIGGDEENCTPVLTRLKRSFYILIKIEILSRGIVNLANLPSVKPLSQHLLRDSSQVSFSTTDVDVKTVELPYTTAA